MTKTKMNRPRDWAIRYKMGKQPASYFQRMTAIGPMFGGTTKTAARFPTRQHALQAQAMFPAMACVGCSIVTLVPLSKGMR